MPDVNQRVGEYVLDERVGQGAYAEVWRAHHHMWSDQLAAVKLPTDPAYVNNLRQEGIRIHRLAHPNVVKPIGFDPMANPPYLMTEFIGGGSLRGILNKRKFSVPETIHILQQVLAGLQFGHEHGVVHGDIKPDNILIEDAGESSGFGAPGSVKITDFGIGLAAAATATGDEAARSRATTGGMLAYVAPEQRDGAAPDVRSDVYAVGVVLFEMLTGERPSGADMPSELNPEVPKGLDEVFRRSYARRERRFASAKEFLEALPANSSAPGPAAVVPAPVVAPAPVSFPSPPAAPVIAPKAAPLPPPPAAPVALKSEPEAEGPMISFRDDDDRRAPIKVEDEDEEPETLEIVEEVVEAPPIEDEPNLRNESAIGNAPGDRARPDLASTRVPQPGETQTPGTGGGRLEYKPIPKVPSRADRNAVFDEANKKQLRTGEDLRGIMRGFYETRDLDEGEVNNVRLRLVKWANNLVGNDADFDQQIVLNSAAARPMHQVTLITRVGQQENVTTRFLDNPAANDIQDSLQAQDYRLLAHISAERFGQRLFTAVANPALRVIVNDMIRESVERITGTVARQDLLIGRANVLTIDYQFEGTRHRAYMLGNSLNVIAPQNPFERIKEEPTKRAAALLDSEQIRLGIKELRRGFDSRWQDKASGMLNALRGKLAGTYMVEAGQMLASFSWLESLENTGKAGQLVPGLEPALRHAALVRKRTTMLELIPGLTVAAVFIAIAVMYVRDPSQPFDAKQFARLFFSNTFFVGAVAAAIATLIAWKKLGIRMARTDVTFYHAMLLPTIVGGIIALGPTRFLDVKGDIICGVLLILAITADVLMFKYLSRYLIRYPSTSPLVGDEATILLRIETLLDHDWERLRPIYLDLGPLYSFAGVKTELPDMTATFKSEQEAHAAPAKAAAPRHAPAGPKPLQPAAVQANVGQLEAQVTGRINAAARNLVPTARTLITLFGEYTKAVSSQQLGMMQSNAGKFEQKGKDLADKIEEFEQLCRAPLTLDAGDESSELRALGEEMAERPNEPDFMLVKSLANLAKNFRADQATAVTELNQMLPQVQAALERMKKL